jgi:hypothetical protein
MTTKRTPTLKQLFKAWIQYQKKSSETSKLKWSLDDLANKTQLGTELIVHEESIYRITTSASWGGQIKYEVIRIAAANEIETIK